ncbi:hypothetical protein DFP72DRAFT_929436 [Ephemerocybe angulata]|uniref:Uncharacterized protein n=1 Tax=Ephemerocybe angulata TaxID=980116 RepID=A0A8H6HDY9_9AGAR|nr:hypothetical protein DFP72DRAFT_929436 [Tulosesus angulatus]
MLAIRGVSLFAAQLIECSSLEYGSLNRSVLQTFQTVHTSPDQPWRKNVSIGSPEPKHTPRLVINESSTLSCSPPRQDTEAWRDLCSNSGRYPNHGRKADLAMPKRSGFRTLSGPQR